MNRCTARVQDHTDTVECGAPVLRADRCIECLAWEVRRLHKEIFVAEDKLKTLRARLGELQEESGTVERGA